MTNAESDASAVARAYEEIRHAPARDTVPALMVGFPPAEDTRVTQANWMFPPFNVWGFRNVARLRPTLEVARGAVSVTSFSERAAALGELTFDSICGQNVSIADHLRATHTDGLIVVQGDDICFEYYANSHSANDRHAMFSVTKSLIGLLAEELISEGTLDISAQTASFIPELAGSAFGDATVAQLLDMAVGVRFSEVYDDPMSESSQYGRACGIYAPVEGAVSHQSLYQFLPSLVQERPHGGFFHYVTATTEVLAWVLERVSGQSCATRLERIWSVIGCQRDGYFIADAWGRNVAGAGFNATLRDMARLGRLIAAGGRHAGKQLVAANAIERILAGSSPEYLGANPGFAKWTPGASYKSQWYVFNDEAMMAGGVHGQYLFVHPQSSTVIVKQSSLPEAVTALDQDSVRMFRAIIDHLQASGVGPCAQPACG
ncbi:serine hydrolase domain-containing protein [Pseudomonas monteilii]|uniref:serine hydrolase domain-containing protein n=1 Tax=Pseudomonas monteilii TaxID=76759 RepID=UPI00383A88A0